MSKFEYVLRVILTLTAIVSVLFFGVNQFTNYLENLGDANLRSAQANCIQYQMPHAVTVDGKIYCYSIYRGSEFVIPLEALEKYYSK